MRWRNASYQPPSAVDEYVSNEFLRLLRDGGPQAMQAEDLPEVNISWIAESRADTARNVVNALCYHRFGEEIYVDRVEVVSDRARGIDFLITLNLAAREILGSCDSVAVRNFDRDTKALLELVKERDEMTQKIYGLKVTTPGVEKEVDDPHDLWRCSVLPCYVTWKNVMGQMSERWLFKMENTTSLWRLADCEQNWVKGFKLTKDQEAARFKINVNDIWRVRVNLDKKALTRIKKAKAKMREERKAAEAEAKRLAAEARSAEDDEEEGAKEEEDEEEDEETLEEFDEELDEEELDEDIKTVLRSGTGAGKEAQEQRPLSKARQLLGEAL